MDNTVTVIDGKPHVRRQIMPGDSWQKLADEYGTSIEYLKRINDRNPPKDRLYITDQLLMPIEE